MRGWTDWESGLSREELRRLRFKRQAAPCGLHMLTLDLRAHCGSGLMEECCHGLDPGCSSLLPLHAFLVPRGYAAVRSRLHFMSCDRCG